MTDNDKCDNACTLKTVHRKLTAQYAERWPLMRPQQSKRPERFAGSRNVVRLQFFGFTEFKYSLLPAVNRTDGRITENRIERICPYSISKAYV